MKVSLPGMIGNACRVLDATGHTDRSFMLRELLKHLEEVRKNPERIGEFFELYVNDTPG